MKNFNLVTDWSAYPDFSPNEFACKHTGLVRMDIEFMNKLQQLRTALGQPLFITSGYRHPTHPIEAQKLSKTAGEHTLGMCADIACAGSVLRFQILHKALELGFTRIGIDSKFIHLGIGADGSGLPQHVIWTY